LAIGDWSSSFQFEFGGNELWFTTAAKAAGLQLLDKLTAHGHRSGSGTAVKKLGVDVAIFCQPADLDVECKTSFRKYWRNNLMCMLVLQRRLFADLLAKLQNSSIPGLPPILWFSSKPGFHAVNF
jgi:hypothetical protein